MNTLAAPVHGASEGRTVEPVAEDRTRLRLLAAAALVAVVGLSLSMVATGGFSWMSALWLVHAIAIPLGLAAYRPPWGRVGVGMALAVAVLLPTWEVAQWISHPQGEQSAHDGGVIVTRAAAHDLIEGRSPYSASYADDLPPEWRMISVSGSPMFVNPIRSVYPYLPGAFLANVPGALLDGVVDGADDPRLVMLACFAAAAGAMARRREAGWARVAALAAFTGPLVTKHLGYGTNDTWAASLVVLAAFAAGRRPRLAGLLLAMAISIKFLVAAAVLPFGLWAWRQGGAAALRRWWTLPALLGATVVPFALWSPADLLDDTLLFWAGRSEVPFPASGFGLAAVAPQVFRGSVLALTSVALAALGAWVAVTLVRRHDHPAILPVATAAVVSGLLIPARSFQSNYIVLVAGLVAPAWLVIGSRLARGSTGPSAVRPHGGREGRSVRPPGTRGRGSARLTRSGTVGAWSNVRPPAPSPTRPAATSSRTPTAG